MKVPSRVLEPLAHLLPLGCAACLASPPDAYYDGGSGVVRAASVEEAHEVASMLGRLRPALLDMLPGGKLADVEVWVQEEPHLYNCRIEANYDAEGLYAPAQERIFLDRQAEDRERVLAHELCHAALSGHWARLPGTLEEGLCDAVAARLVPEGAARLRAGRLSSAALACGGLQLQLEVREREPSCGARLGWSARISLTSEEPSPEAHLDVFRVSAGLSSTHIKASVKRGYYGLSFLVIERILQRHDLEGLHRLCRAAAAEGHASVPQRWLQEAAELDDDPLTWRAAAAAAMDSEELAELVRMYPGFVADALTRYVTRGESDLTPRQRLDSIDAELRLLEGDASVRVTDLGFMRTAVLERIAAR